MNPDFRALEGTWMGAVQHRDRELLDRILDDQFICTAWSSAGELTTRDEYLASVGSAEFGCCDVAIDGVNLFGDTAVVRCRLECDCVFGQNSWRASFLVTDVWIRRGELWKAVSRHASVPLGEWSAIMSLRKGVSSAAPIDSARGRAEGA